MGTENSESSDWNHSYIEEFADILKAKARGHGWALRPEDVWCHVQPPGKTVRAQGWKIHVSATPKAASATLAAVAEVLLEKAVTFKFAKGLPELRQLLSIRADRGSSGKFITVYPDDDKQFAELLEELHQATLGAEGPTILSDRKYRPDSVVHYRYGGFRSQRVLDNDGSYYHLIVTPSGEWTEDARNAWYSPPAWAQDPISPPPERPKERPTKIKLDDRFVVFEAIRHSNRGGVYRAIDEQTGNRVVIKEARPHVGAEPDGSDARKFLRNEYEMLRLLEPLNLAVRPITLFEYQGNTFLAEEEVTGQTLQLWIESQLRPRPDWVMPLDRAVDMAGKLVALVGAVHDKGLVFRDFTSTNVMVTPDEELVMIDTEFVAEPGQPVHRVMTMGYVAPEELSGPPTYPAPQPSADLYSVGAVLFYLCCGAHPLLPVADPAQDGQPAETRSHDERVRTLIDAIAAENTTMRAFAPILKALLGKDPAARPAPRRIEQLLAGLTSAPVTGNTGPTLLADDAERKLLDDGVAHLLEAMDPEAPGYLWPAYPLEGRLFDPYSVQAGAAGPLHLLGTLSRTGGGEATRDKLRTALHWFDERVEREPRTLPGLYFGRAGTYWAMYEAAVELGETEIAERTARRAKHLPVVWKNPDITHGVSGCGLTQLRLFQHTQDEEFRHRAGLCVESVLKGRSLTDMVWPLSSDTPRAGDGLTHYGFAHGVAGICYFLLSAGDRLDRPDLLELAKAGGDLLVSLAWPSGDGLKWPTAQKEANDSETYNGVCWWCSGGPGIGTFLIRLWKATGDARYLEACRGAAIATRGEKWLLSTGHCHGLTGNAEFLLDMAAATGERQYADWAREHVIGLQRLTVQKGDRLLIVDDSSRQLSYSYNLGLAGPLSMLHRLRHGGERAWMLDGLPYLPDGVR
ncbi:Protein kinase domain-containing protein [Amycolatopsis xylanica]|uniref:Protein kinase domain-containing protein n=1 Tax=Amycolatopsis xylanica TaxID=589385 RepID=A0A1H3GH98_9PSEU|nr:class IV lanthionine synthetase LanL [Amycolatopsis xylanica]SDY01669.1 Protein kinase domain-containing protein [Amycolatopsis xylanica]